MSEKILQALMQLFAIGSALERATLQSRAYVEEFLRQQISLHRIDEYLQIYDSFIDKLQGREDDSRTRKKIAGSSVRMLRLASDINKELNIRQKHIVFFRLLEFMQSSPAGITLTEEEFLQTLAEVFTISPQDYRLSLALTAPQPDLTLLDAASILFVSPEKVTTVTSVKQIVQPEAEGLMIFLFLKNASIMVMRYTGNNPLNVNGQPVDNKYISILSQGAVVRGARLQPLYYSFLLRTFLSDSLEDDFTFSVENLEYVFPNGKKGIHSLSFSVESGTLAGIMGSSGAGKSTLLNILNGSSPPSHGTVSVNGENIFANNSVRDLIGNIPQDDLLIEELTVFQNLYYNTRLCFGTLSDNEIVSRVNEVLESLGLQEIKHLRVGNSLNKTISGGQRKRLNIGLELVRQPAILFVDEPTSGLSSRDAENVMDLLKQIAIGGKLVFVVIHQPSSDIFRMFDQLLMLDTGGYPVYFGNPSDALIYFKKQVHLTDAEQSECYVCGNINPEQLFNIIELHEINEIGQSTGNRKIKPVEWNELYRKWFRVEAAAKQKKILPPANRKASPFQQWRIFFTRDLRSKLSNSQYMFINMFEAPVLAVILAFILRYSSSSDYQLASNPNLPAYLFISVIVALFLGLSVSAEEIIRDRKIQQREKFLHLSRTAYLLSKISLLFILSAIQTVCFVIAGNMIMGIHDMNHIYWIVLFSTSCFANLLGLNFSSALNSAVTVYILIPFLLIPQILLSGVIVRFERLHPMLSTEEGVPLIGNVMTSRWAFEALAVSQFAGNPFERKFFNFDAQMSRSTYKKDWWFPAMRERVAHCENLLKSNASKDSLRASLALLSYEFGEEKTFHAPGYFPFSLPVEADKFSHAVAQQMRETLDKLREFYIDKFNQVSNAKEKMISSSIASEPAEKKFQDEKNRYENESLEELVRSSNVKERLVVTESKIIQRFEPVFHYKSTEDFFKAPLYSSVKNIFDGTLNTLHANLLVIWGMTLLLYFTLQIDLFRKLMQQRFFSKR